VPLALAAALAIGVIATATVQAGIFCHTIPREVAAVDVNTGGPYFAPPIPNGCYAKDPVGTILEGIGMVHGCLSNLCGSLSNLHGCCPGCHGLGQGCNLCGGTGKCGHCDQCSGAGLGHSCGDPCAACGGNGGGCGFCAWRALLHGHGAGGGCGGGMCSSRNVKQCGFAGHASTVCASTQAPVVSAQAACPSAQSLCGQAGCLLKMRHFHRLGKGCSACNGAGCGICQGGGMSSGSLCGSCGGAGCNLCGGLGLLAHGKHGTPCSACGGHGCALCGGTGMCTGLCSKMIGGAAGLVAKALHIGDAEYFVGPGGPVPITPGYVPYVVTTRAPRDFLAFPPFSQLDP
jgi:hypothetical protein